MMKIINKLLAATVIISMVIPFLPAFAEDESGDTKSQYEKFLAETPHKSEVIVKTKDNVPLSNVAPLQAQISLFSVEPQPLADENITVIPVSEEEMPQLLEDLNKNENVVYAQPNYRVNLNDIDIRQWGLQNTGQSANTYQGTEGYDINVTKAWTITQGSPNVVIGVLDTGIDINHEALADKIWTNPADTQNDADDDGNGYYNDIHGWDFPGDDNSVYDGPQEDEHGTHVAGIIASVAPGVKLLPLKAFNYSSGYTDDIIEAIHYAEDMGVKIVNCSFSTLEYNTALADTMGQSDILFVTAAGNYARSTDELAPFPACYDFDNILSVASINSAGELSPFSTYGDKIDIAAPGSSIYSTLPENQYGFMDGTSMSAGFASGAAALALSNNSGLTASQIRQSIINSATTPVIMPEGVTEQEYLIDVNAAVTYELPPEEPIAIPDDIPPFLGSEMGGGSSKEEKSYPFSFNMINGEFTLALDNGTIFDTLDVSIYDKTASSDISTLYSAEIPQGQTSVVIPNWQIEVNYTFTMEFMNAGGKSVFIGEVKIFYSEALARFVADFAVNYSNLNDIGSFTTMASPISESEDNGQYYYADPVLDDQNVTGYISTMTDNDWFYISFTQDGVANFFLDVPDGCNYELWLYHESDTTNDLSHACNQTLGANELISLYPVEAGEIYYIRIYAWSGTYSTTDQYMLRSKWYPSPVDAEPNNIFGDAIEIYNANWTGEGNINNPNDRDFYYFKISETRYVNIVLTSLPENTDYDFKIYNQQNESESAYVGGSINASTDEGYANEFAPGTYYIIVYPYNGYSADTYELSVISGTYSSSLNLNNPSIAGSVLNSVGKHFYYFSTSDTLGLNMDLIYNSGNFHLYLYMKNEHGFYDWLSAAASGGSPKNLAQTLYEGEYILIIYRDSGTATNYTLSTMSTTEEYVSQITISGLPQTSTLVSGTSYAVTVSAKNIGYMNWTSSNVSLVASSGSNTSLFTSSLPISVSGTVKFGQTKTFTVNLTAPSTPGQYTIGFDMKLGSTKFNNAATKQVSVIRQYDEIPLKGSPPSGSTSVSGVTEKTFKLSIQSTGWYVFRTFNLGSNDTTLTLYNSDMTQVGYDDDGGYMSGASKICKGITSTSTGTYYLKVAECYNNIINSCGVLVTKFTPSTITLDSNNYANVSVSGQIVGYYVFTPSVSGTYVIKTARLNNIVCNTYLCLTDSQSGKWFKNDDGNGLGFYSLLTPTLSAGKDYYLDVTNYTHAMSNSTDCTYATVTIMGPGQVEEPPQNEAGSVDITAPYSGQKLKVYRGHSIKIQGTCSNVSSVRVTVNGNEQQPERSGSKFTASFTPEQSGRYTIQATGTAIVGSNPTDTVSVDIIANDDGDDPRSATEAENGTERYVSIDISDPVDYFSFSPPETGSYIFNFDNPDGQNNSDSELTLYDSPGYNILDRDSRTIIEELRKGNIYYLSLTGSQGTSGRLTFMKSGDGGYFSQTYNCSTASQYTDIPLYNVPANRCIAASVEYANGTASDIVGNFGLINVTGGYTYPNMQSYYGADPNTHMAYFRTLESGNYTLRLQNKNNSSTLQYKVHVYTFDTAEYTKHGGNGWDEPTSRNYVISSHPEGLGRYYEIQAQMVLDNHTDEELTTLLTGSSGMQLLSNEEQNNAVSYSAQEIIAVLKAVAESNRLSDEQERIYSVFAKSEIGKLLLGIDGDTNTAEAITSADYEQMGDYGHYLMKAAVNGSANIYYEHFAMYRYAGMTMKYGVLLHNTSGKSVNIQLNGRGYDTQADTGNSLEAAMLNPWQYYRRWQLGQGNSIKADNSGINTSDTVTLSAGEAKWVNLIDVPINYADDYKRGTNTFNGIINLRLTNAADGSLYDGESVFCYTFIMAGSAEGIRAGVQNNTVTLSRAWHHAIPLETQIVGSGEGAMLQTTLNPYNWYDGQYRTALGGPAIPYLNINATNSPDENAEWASDVESNEGERIVLRHDGTVWGGGEPNGYTIPCADNYGVIYRFDIKAVQAAYADTIEISVGANPYVNASRNNGNGDPGAYVMAFSNQRVSAANPDGELVIINPSSTKSASLITVDANQDSTVYIVTSGMSSFPPEITFRKH